ncbi:MAG: hypothetical protein A2Z34_02080 [Planctomycetes bacterium RBG_16_59_8]|nr:MAG: hypothetical protein A2Z34_02080 [Planctomycetes bacterium RBG_16_59_8]
MERLVKKPYGRYLTIYYIGRLDQIHFKLYAATDRLYDRNDYHRQDLLALIPTDSEIEQAARWTLTQDVSEEFRVELRDCLRKIGYGAVAKRI